MHFLLCTVTVVGGAVVAAISGGTRRKLGFQQVRQKLHDSTSSSYDPLQFKTWMHHLQAMFRSRGEVLLTHHSALSMQRTTRIMPPPSPQALQLDASASVDEDDVDTDFEFRWYCEDTAGGTCMTRAGETLDLSSFADEAVLFLPAGSLPSGEPGRDSKSRGGSRAETAT